MLPKSVLLVSLLQYTEYYSYILTCLTPLKSKHSILPRLDDNCEIHESFN